MKRFSVLLVLALAACVPSQGSAQEKGPEQAAAKAANASPKFYREGLSRVVFSGLDAVAKERALKILNSQGCDCGRGMTIAQCRVENQSCSRSPVLAAAVVNAVRQGKTDQQAIAAVNALRASARAAVPASKAAATTPVPSREIRTEGSPFHGPAKAPVTVVAFKDFQCPYCARAIPVVKQILNAYPNDVRFVFKHFPLSFHKQARPAAIAAVAAQRQDKFWEMHDLLFKNMRALDDASLRRYAQSLGLDMARFDRDLEDPAIGRLVDQEAMEAQRSGVRGTPTFFVNGVRAPSWDFNTLKRLVGTAKAGGDVNAEAGKVMADLRKRQAEAGNRRPKIDYNKVYDIDTNGSPNRGNVDAAVTIAVFSDYQ